mmetsp:Transcript_134922/g.269221  ORF Transcript_134922/g.269221 Transcript_134922/m.269221 type:complete len:468 (-) Transcript_134922:182-1585(-)
MLKYTYNRNRGCVAFLRRLFRLQGSVAPRSGAAAFLSGVVSSSLTWASGKGWMSNYHDLHVTTNKAAWLIYSGLVGFLIVFRMNQAYQRFWEGCAAVHRMRVDWFMASCLLMAYCRTSKANPSSVRNFQLKLIRLVSLIHAAALAELEQITVHEVPYENVAAYQFELLDPAGFDNDTLKSLKVSHRKVELLFAWIMMMTVQSADEGVMEPPPPVLSQAMQLLCKGMDSFHDALRITCIPFPFPYVQSCDMLILLHCLMTPVVMVSWCESPVWAGVLTFLQVFCIQALDKISLEIEDPFGQDPNDLDCFEMQRQMNNHLVLLLRGKAAPLPELTLGSFTDFEDASLPTRQTVHGILTGIEGKWVESDRASITFEKGKMRGTLKGHGTRRAISHTFEEPIHREQTKDSMESEHPLFPCVVCMDPRCHGKPSEKIQRARGPANSEVVGDRDLFADFEVSASASERYRSQL